MKHASASAPGKMVLCGEYAVLAGAAAVVTAVDRRALAALDLIDGDECLVAAPGLSAGMSRFRRLAAGNYSWSGERFPLVEQVLDACPGAAGLSLSMRLDTQAFRDRASGRKLGLGSSAALAVALAAALGALFPGGTGASEMAAAAHRAYQSGSGSGADVAACFAGGTIRFERAVTPGAEPRIRAMPWPDGLGYRVLWSGRSSDTAARLRQLEARKALECDSARALMDSAGRVADLWGRSSNDVLLDALRSYVVRLQQFSTDQALGIFDAGHEELLAPAAKLGLVYKPSGAGGGDTGVAFGTSAVALDAFCDHAARGGFARLDISFAARGVTIDQGLDA